MTNAERLAEIEKSLKHSDTDFLPNITTDSANWLCEQLRKAWEAILILRFAIEQARAALAAEWSEDAI